MSAAGTNRLNDIVVEKEAAACAIARRELRAPWRGAPFIVGDLNRYSGDVRPPRVFWRRRRVEMWTVGPHSKCSREAERNIISRMRLDRPDLNQAPIELARCAGRIGNGNTSVD